MERFWSKVDKSGECWEWLGHRAVYGSFWHEGRTQSAHRVAWQLAHGPIPRGLLVMHACDNPICVRPDHLRLGTYAENSRDMALKGRASQGDAHYARQHPERLARGERSGQARFTADQIRTLRSRHQHGVSMYRLAKDYGVSHTAISAIVQRKVWRHVA